MGDQPSSSHWALKIAATAGSDLNVAEKLALETYEKANLLHPGLVARVSHVEILNRETGQSGTYAFVGVGVGFGAGIISADLGDKWHPFDTKEPIALEEFGRHPASLYNMSAGLGFNWAPISGIRFEGIDINRDSKWETFWHGNGISVGGPTTVNAGTSLDVSEVVGRLFTIHQEEGNLAVIEHLDELNQICVAHDLGATHINDASPYVTAHPGSGGDVASPDANYSDPSGHAIHVDPTPGHAVQDVSNAGHAPDVSSMPDTHGPGSASHQ